MSKRRRARRGQSFWALMQRSPRHQRYTSKRMEISAKSVAMPENIFRAAQAAGEAIHAHVQVIPNVQGYAVAPESQGSAEHSVPVQPENSEEATQGSSGSAQ